jgi:hypothetical protein
MNSRKVAAVLLAGLMLTASGAALSIEIDLFDFGGDDSASSGNNSSSGDSGDDQRFSYGGENSDQITDKEGVKKGLMEQIVSAVVNTLFG